MESQRKIKDIRPEDTIPLLGRITKFIFGEKKPDSFTQLMFSIALFIWVLLAFWNALCYFVLISSEVIEETKHFSVNNILIKNGQGLGFGGEEFVGVIQSFYFYNNFIWLFIFIGLVLMYRKKRIYSTIVFTGLTIHFLYMLFVLGFRYFINDVSSFDKILYAVFIVILIIHSFLLKKEEKDAEITDTVQ